MCRSAARVLLVDLQRQKLDGAARARLRISDSVLRHGLVSSDAERILIDLNVEVSDGAARLVSEFQLKHQRIVVNVIVDRCLDGETSQLLLAAWLTRLDNLGRRCPRKAEVECLAGVLSSERICPVTGIIGFRLFTEQVWLLSKCILEAIRGGWLLRGAAELSEEISGRRDSILGLRRREKAAGWLLRWCVKEASDRLLRLAKVHAEEVRLPAKARARLLLFGFGSAHAEQIAQEVDRLLGLLRLFLIIIFIFGAILLVLVFFVVGAIVQGLFLFLFLLFPFGFLRFDLRSGLCRISLRLKVTLLGIILSLCQLTLARAGNHAGRDADVVEFAHFLWCLVIYRADGADLGQQLLNDSILVSVDLQLIDGVFVLQHHFGGLLRRRREHTPVDVGPIPQIRIVDLLGCLLQQALDELLRVFWLLEVQLDACGEHL